MNGSAVVPAPDAIPLPAPAGLLSALLVAAFFVHALAMMASLGGGFWAWRAQAHAALPGFGPLARRIGGALPYWMAGTVTSGVAALLFLQVLYGPVFYAASAIGAWPWLSVVLLVLLGYAGYYRRASLAERDPAAGRLLGLLAWLALVLAALGYVAVMSYMLHPERHYADYLAHPGGLFLPVADRTVLPRFLHMVVGAVAAAGAWVAWLAARAVARGEEGARGVLDWASAGFCGSMLLELLLGLWFLGLVPHPVGRVFLGGEVLPTGSLVLSLLLTASAIRLGWKARSRDDPRRAAAALLGHVVLIALCMAVLRDALRRATLAGSFDPAAAPAAPQWGAIALFAILTLAGVAVVAWMVRVTLRGSPPGAPPAGSVNAP